MQGLCTSGPIRGLCVNPAGFLPPPPTPGLSVGDRTAQGWYEGLEGSPNTAKKPNSPAFFSPIASLLCAKTTITYLFDEWEFLPGLLCSENALE